MTFRRVLTLTLGVLPLLYLAGMILPALWLLAVAFTALAGPVGIAIFLLSMGLVFQAIGLVRALRPPISRRTAIYIAYGSVSLSALLVYDLLDAQLIPLETNWSRWLISGPLLVGIYHVAAYFHSSRQSLLREF